MMGFKCFMENTLVYCLCYERFVVFVIGTMGIIDLGELQFTNKTETT